MEKPAPTKAELIEQLQRVRFLSGNSNTGARVSHMMDILEALINRLPDPKE